MEPAGIGLTCREALAVFSQYETLRLQQRVFELETEMQKIKQNYLTQLERIEWAANVMWQNGIRCGCCRFFCGTCQKTSGACTCLIKTCQCRLCLDEDKNHCDDKVGNNLMPYWYHPKGQTPVRRAGGAKKSTASGGAGAQNPLRQYCGFEFCDPRWYATHNVLATFNHYGTVDVTTPELLETFLDSL